MRRLAILAALACVLCARAGAGGIEPFLARLAEDGVPKPAARTSPLFVWDEKEAARGRARAWILREAGTAWESLGASVLAVSSASAWEGSAGDFAQIVSPWGDLPEIARLPGVAYVLRPPRGMPAVESEGLAAMQVAPFRARGYRGEGVRVAIVDLGFKGYESLLGSELPAQVHVRSFFNSPSGDGDINGDNEDHGTACAELLCDVAPDVDLYLVNVNSPIDLRAAVDWLVKEKVAVISHSVGWYFGGLNGEGPLDEIADDAAKRGIVWVNAAGNEAERHTWAAAVDADGDRYLEFGGEPDETLDFNMGQSEELVLALMWDAWPLSTSLDLAIEVADMQGQVLATSDTNFPDSYPFAFRLVKYSPEQAGSVAARVRLKRGSLDGRTIHVFRIGQGVRMQEHRRPDRSLLPPSDSRSVLTVGAVDYATGQLDSYSSRGALEGEPVKPELCGPVGVSTATYGPFGFRGTSAAAPQVAGAAALVASAGVRGGMVDLNLERDDVLAMLGKSATPAPEIVPLAWGIVRLPTPAAAGAVPGPVLFGNPAHGSVRWSAACGAVEVVDAGGRVLGRAVDGSWDGRDRAGRIMPAGIYWLRCPGGLGTRVVRLGGE